MRRTGIMNGMDAARCARETMRDIGMKGRLK